MTALVTIGTLAKAWLATLLMMAGQGTLLAALALVLARAGKLRPAWQASIWLVVTIKLALPWGPAMPYSLSDVIAMFRSHPAPAPVVHVGPVVASGSDPPPACTICTVVSGRPHCASKTCRSCWMVGEPNESTIMIVRPLPVMPRWYSGLRSYAVRFCQHRQSTRTQARARMRIAWGWSQPRARAARCNWRCGASSMPRSRTRAPKIRRSSVPAASA